MRITVQLTADATRRVRGAPPDKRHAVLQWLLQPLDRLHPDTSDPALASFFAIEVADSREAAGLVDRLLADSAVEAAYIKPDDELPSR